MKRKEIIKKQKRKLHHLIVIGDKEYDISYVSEFRWISENRFCVWVQFCWLEEFIDGLKNIFGEQLFDDGGVNVNMQSDCICIDMCELLNGYLDVKDIIDIFPKEKFQ